MSVRIGTAGWNVPRAHAHVFSSEGTHLSRYAAVMKCAEINSSFYKPHALKTWQRWAESTPEGFRFSVKAPKTITHEAKLIAVEALLEPFVQQIAGLGDKLGPLLFQLPPRLAFEDGMARSFFKSLRNLHASPIALEPRHESWFTPEVAGLLSDFGVTRVAADPPKGSPSASSPAGFPGLRYYRLHGSPRIYWSAYEENALKALAEEIRSQTEAETWVIFDNTASGAALGNAVELEALLELHPSLVAG